MTVLPFRPSPAAPVPTRWRVELRKGRGRRLYEVVPVGGSLTQTWVRFDGKPHRAKLTRTHTELQDIRAQFDREILALEADGWVRT